MLGPILELPKGQACGWVTAHPNCPPSLIVGLKAALDPGSPDLESPHGLRGEEEQALFCPVPGCGTRDLLGTTQGQPGRPLLHARRLTLNLSSPCVRSRDVCGCLL